MPNFELMGHNTGGGSLSSCSTYWSWKSDADCCCAWEGMMGCRHNACLCWDYIASAQLAWLSQRNDWLWEKTSFCWPPWILLFCEGVKLLLFSCILHCTGKVLEAGGTVTQFGALRLRWRGPCREQFVRALFQELHTVLAISWVGGTAHPQGRIPPGDSIQLQHWVCCWWQLHSPHTHFSLAFVVLK